MSAPPSRTGAHSGAYDVASDAGMGAEKNAVMDVDALRPWIATEIERHAADLEQMGALLTTGPLAPDLRDELTILARYVLQVHDRQMPLMIALQRGGEATADL